MKTRNTPKSATVAKRTPPPAKKAAAKAQTPPSPAEVKVDSSPTATPEAFEPKLASAGRQKQVDVTPISEPGPSGVYGNYVIGSCRLKIIV